MNTFEHAGKRYCIINGKEYYLLRGYRDLASYKGQLIFMQVAGRTSLHIEDLPDPGWTIIKTRTGEATIYTAYRETWFDYHLPAEGKSKRVLFIGMTDQGSQFLMLNFLRESYNLKPSTDQFAQALRWTPTRRGDVEIRQDQGNSKTMGLSVEIGPYKMDYDRAQELFGLSE